MVTYIHRIHIERKKNQQLKINQFKGELTRMRKLPKGFFRSGIVVLILLGLAGLLAGCGGGKTTAEKSSGSEAAKSKTRTIILGAYTVPKEAYQKNILPAFRKYWKGKTGEDVEFKESYVASGAQAKAIIGGFEADVAALSLEGDVDKITKAGLITNDWKSSKEGGFVTDSVVVIGTRKGNPKGIKDWEDLTKPGIQVLYPNPKTSGGAMWDVNAIYGAALKYSEVKKGQKDYAYAKDFLKKVQKNVKVMDKSGRESFTTFEKGVGDAVVTYESEVLRVLKDGADYEVIYPRSTILIKNPVAIVDKSVEKHGNRDVVEAFVDFLYHAESQKAFAEAGFRPVDKDVAANYKDNYPVPELLFGIEYLGGWGKVIKEIYGPEGVWTKGLEELAKS